MEITVQLPRQVAGRAAPDDGIAASAKISPRRFTLSVSDAVSGDEASLHVEELLNVVDPRASTTSVNQSARTVTVSLAKWGREKLPWPTLVQEPPAFENDPRSPYQNVLAQETAPPPDQVLERLWLGGIGNLPRGRRWFADNEITHTLSVCDYWPVRNSARVSSATAHHCTSLIACLRACRAAFCGAAGRTTGDGRRRSTWH